MTSITCNRCFQIFEFTEKQQIFFAEKGFPAPKKCKKCKDNQKNKKEYTYIPSQKELELKEKMDKKMEVVKAIKTNRFSPIKLNETIIEEITNIVKSGKNWADNVEEEEKKQQNTKKNWADIVEEEEERQKNTIKSWANIVKC